VIADMDEDGDKDVVTSVEKAGGHAVFVRADVTWVRDVVRVANW
jgi:hypothetical protein